MLDLATGREVGVAERDKDFFEATEGPATLLCNVELAWVAVTLVLAAELVAADGVVAAGESWAGGR